MRKHVGARQALGLLLSVTMAFGGFPTQVLADDSAVPVLGAESDTSILLDDGTLADGAETNVDVAVEIDADAVEAEPVD